MPIYDVRTMQSLYEKRAVATPVYIVKTVTGLGVLALILSCIGLYGIVSYAVNRRTREFGVRMAVGANRSRVAGLVLGGALKLGLAGTAVGLVLGILISDLLQTQILFAFDHIGPLPYIGVCIVIILTVCIAGFVPAQRASRIDPIRALREE
jgi:ABC-type antimicrobial peptide transport system permease subunit